jgi:signal transduction histidine kinase
MLSKLDEDVPLPAEPVNISEVTTEVLSVYQDYARTRTLHFNVRVESDITISINKESYRQILSILLDNALKYTPDNGFIHLSLVRNGRHIQIIEENTCDASLEPDPERWFERFYRGDAGISFCRKNPLYCRIVEVQYRFTSLPVFACKRGGFLM